jgi:hypothetical protein
LLTLAEVKNQIEELDAGYAVPLVIKNDMSLLLFKNVEDHIDGNGLASLTLIGGSGFFHIEGEKIKMFIGDTIVFNDNQEHGFEANEYCLAFNVSFYDNLPTVEAIQEKIDVFLRSIPRKKILIFLTLISFNVK